MCSILFGETIEPPTLYSRKLIDKLVDVIYDDYITERTQIGPITYDQCAIYKMAHC